ncbi:conserved hypothetical protein [Histoplasma capsulatum G186AR]|uniref:Uncharacterized protein n=2 Tax=Ajellomyces capsulatus TaxID=5037 RepID=C0NFZ0_AJECG|nr:uncharacterized protein HCBG_01806 [Histoplasma capsulatum G186AR]EEH10161.1 conserved hypothetical protein [Histoplasma capsulatum G186AR]KAG5290887.1 hypothetical protein I7I52_08040 [Histoplasma capsulatum]QSS72814.1 hypothetical protein I7I50_00772 [Histoplasma capsulatum G186AR]
MVEYIPPPDPRTLIPPLLACIATAFSSPKPPPALLPLISPILRQRVQILSSVSQSPSDSWLRLLCWDAGKAERLQNIVEGATFEPHPVSGEIEIPDDVPITYKRLDTETLRSHLPIPDFNLSALYVWCPVDLEGSGPGWRVAEVLPGDALQEEAGSWSGSIGEADEYRQVKLLRDALQEAEDNESHKVASKISQGHVVEPENEKEDEDDDDGYWAQYDNTPGKTPLKRSPAPIQSQYNGLGPGPYPTSSDSYFARYNRVQPALDNDDPAVDRSELGQSTLNGDTIASILQQQSEVVLSEAPTGAALYDDGKEDYDSLARSRVLLSHPRPSSASSSGGSETVSKLEKTAESQSLSEMGVKQHISSNIKSLFRLARATGLSRAEFESIVRRELDCLALTDVDNYDE